jgi:hypothetical protein
MSAVWFDWGTSGDTRRFFTLQTRLSILLPIGVEGPEASGQVAVSYGFLTQSPDQTGRYNL